MTHPEKEPLRVTEDAPDAATNPDNKKKYRRLWLLLLLILLAMAAAVLIARYAIPRSMIEANVQSASQFDESDVAVTPEVSPERNVMNIALFGIDQKKGSVGRSDAMLILSIDKDHNTIKLTSIARDSLVPIDGHGEEKLTHAWAYGHAKLALKTINQNYGMNITEYAYVNFNEFIDAIDYLGGIYIDLTAAEQAHLNQTIMRRECENHYGYEPPLIPGDGRRLLNGVQALQFARNRTDGDGNRTTRHQEVLTAVYERVRSQPLTKLPATVARMLRLCHTSLDSDEIVDLANWALSADPETESFSLPNAQIPTQNGIIDKKRGWVRVYDLDLATQLLHNFIYGTDLPVTTATAEEATPTEP